MLKSEQINFDDKNYEELLKEAIEQLPLLNKSWTDFNPSDPGITFLELLTWLSESQRYYLNQITDKHRLKYLALLGDKPRDIQPATLPTVFLPKDTVIKKGEQAVLDGIPFTLEQDLELSDSKLTLSKELDGAAARIYGFMPFGERPCEGDCFYLRFDKPISASFGFFVKVIPPKGALRNRMEDGYLPLAVLHFEVWSDEGWQKCTATDKTYGFMQNGGISLQMPVQGSLIRCTLSQCQIDIPPMFERIFPFYSRLIQYHEVYGGNSYLAENGYLLAAFKKQGDGYIKAAKASADILVYADKPYREAEYLIEDNRIEPDTDGLKIIANDFSMLVCEDDGVYRRWNEVNDLSCSSALDRHYVLDAGKGVIYFGDNIRGKNGHSAVITSMRLTHGDVFINKNHKFNIGEASAYNPTVSDLGSDPETVEQAFCRYNTDKRKACSAVSAADYTKLVMQTPGLCIENVNVFSTEIGIINICVKSSDGKLSDTYIRNIRRHIYDKRLPCSEIRITPPILREFTCCVRIQPQDWALDKASGIKSFVDEFFSKKEKVFGLKISLSDWAEEIENCEFIKRLEEIFLKGLNGEVLSRRDRITLPPDTLLSIIAKEIIIGR